MADAHTPPAPGELTLAQALAGVRPRPMTDAEWAAMHQASAAYHGEWTDDGFVPVAFPEIVWRSP